ncbi:MAG: hypothetical protein RPT25_02730 [Cycloclasticus sp.]
MNKRNLHIVFATSEPEIANRMLKSIDEKLPNHILSVAALFIGRKSTVDLSRFCLPVTCIGTYKDYLSIAESRNLCQAYLQRAMRESGGLGLVLDDDLRWIMPETDFEILCEKLSNKGCDMAFSALTGDAPVPKEYTRASPLLDVLLEISINDTSPAVSDIIDFIKGINVVGEVGSEINCHHDYYAYDKNAFYKAPINIESLEWNDFFNRLYVGKKTTRPILTPSKVTPATGRERGGATLIFNSSVLSYANQTIQCGCFISRRSDMIMATSAKNCGYVLFNTPAVLSHNRSDSFDSHDSRKLIGDILGYALVESSNFGVYSGHQFSINLSKRLISTVEILQETSITLILLRDWLRERRNTNSGIEGIIKKMVLENSKTVLDIQSLDVSKALVAFNYFSDSYPSKKAG